MHHRKQNVTHNAGRGARSANNFIIVVCENIFSHALDKKFWLTGLSLYSSYQLLEWLLVEVIIHRRDHSCEWPFSRVPLDLEHSVCVVGSWCYSEGSMDSAFAAWMHPITISHKWNWSFFLFSVSSPITGGSAILRAPPLMDKHLRDFWQNKRLATLIREIWVRRPPCSLYSLCTGAMRWSKIGLVF